MKLQSRHDGPPEDYTKTYGSFLERLLREGYTFYGPAREIFEEARENLQPGIEDRDTAANEEGSSKEARGIVCRYPCSSPSSKIATP